MESRDSQGVQSATLALPPRTIGVAGAAPADALAFITLIQQNASAVTKSPGADARAANDYAPTDRPAVKEDRPAPPENRDATETDEPTDDEPALLESNESDDDRTQLVVPPATDETAVDEDGPVEDEADEEDVLIGEAKAAVAVEDAPAKSPDEAAVAAADAEETAASEPLNQLGNQPTDDHAAAAETPGEQDETLPDFDVQAADAVAEKSSAAADSQALADSQVADGKQADADGKQAGDAADNGTIPVQELVEQQATAEETPTDEAESEKIRAAQEAAAAALEPEPVDDGPTDAQQFAADRREASEKISEAQQARHEADVDASVDPTADVAAPATPQPVVETTPGTNAALAAAEPIITPVRDVAGKSSTPTTGETPSVNEPGLGTAIQRGLERGLLQKAKSTSDAPKLDSAKQIQLIQRVSQAVRTAQTQGGPIRLRLSPPELGSLRVELEVEEGGVKAKLEAESESVRKVLLDSLPQLRDRLAEMNLRVDSFDVSVGQNGNPQDAGGTFADQQQNSSNGQSYNGQRSSPSNEKSTAETTSTPIVTGDGQLNVMV